MKIKENEIYVWGGVDVEMFDITPKSIPADLTSVLCCSPNKP
jgi:hypothetical protein